MTLLNEQHVQALESVIAEVESKTDAEIVLVVAEQADDYHYIPTLWAAMLALLVPLLMWFGGAWIELPTIMIAQWLVFIGLALLLRWRPVMHRIIPKQVRYWRASNLARRQFLEQNLHHTRGASGVLLFISEAEHYVEVLADSGIANKVGPEYWQQIVDTVTSSIKKGQLELGLLDAVVSCGEVLAKEVPATDAKNELPNRVVLL